MTASNSLRSCCAIITFWTPCQSVWTKHHMLVTPKSLFAFIMFVLLSVTHDCWLPIYTYHAPSPALWEALVWRPWNSGFLLGHYSTLGYFCLFVLGYLYPLGARLWCASVWSRPGECGIPTWSVHFTGRFWGREHTKTGCMMEWIAKYSLNFNMKLARSVLAVGSSGLPDSCRVCVLKVHCVPSQIMFQESFLGFVLCGGRIV